jgi:putative pyruvate formate lyase activating enzyme
MGHGRDMDTDELSGHMLELQSRGAHNINLVTATHFIPQWYAALVRARQRGLVIPLVYNTSGYERVEVLRQIHGAVDVYLPDVKYADNEAARYCSDAPRYVEVDRAAVREMLRQTGRLRTDRRGIARRGTIVRHMVLPSGLSGTREVLQFVAGLRPRVHVSLMGQYFPAHRARDVPGLDRRLTEEEYTQALDLLDELGLKQGWVQGFREQGGC